MDRVTEWNNSIVEVEMLERFTQHLDLVYTVGVGGGAGLIKSRFVCVLFLLFLCDRHHAPNIGGCVWIAELFCAIYTENMF